VALGRRGPWPARRGTVVRYDGPILQNFASPSVTVHAADISCNQVLLMARGKGREWTSFRTSRRIQTCYETYSVPHDLAAAPHRALTHPRPLESPFDWTRLGSRPFACGIKPASLGGRVHPKTGAFTKLYYTRPMTGDFIKLTPSPLEKLLPADLGWECDPKSS